MDPNSLREHIKSLNEELAAARRVNPRNEELLDSITAQIQALIDQPGAIDDPAAVQTSPVIADEPDDSLSDRLERIAVQFEVDHPTLAASSRRLIDLLGKAGL